LLPAGLNYSNNVKAYIMTKFFCKVERHSNGSRTGVTLSRYFQQRSPYFTGLRAPGDLLNRINLIPPVQSHRQK
jgi:hypothetical protein